MPLRDDVPNTLRNDLRALIERWKHEASDYRPSDLKRSRVLLEHCATIRSAASELQMLLDADKVRELEALGRLQDELNVLQADPAHGVRELLMELPAEVRVQLACEVLAGLSEQDIYRVTRANP